MRMNLFNQEDHVAIVLAGGAGERLRTLTAERTKPAVPIFGTYLIGDFILSSAVRSQMFGTIMVLTQYKAHSFIHHIARMYPSSTLYERYIDVVPAQQQKGKQWYQHTADAVWQNEYHWKDCNTVTILSADHITKIDFRQMYERLYDLRSDFMVAVMELDVAEVAGRFGVFTCDKNMRIIGFEEKPQSPREIPGKPGKCLASAGIYMANGKKLHEALKTDSENEQSNHDFGGDVIPWMIKNKFIVHYYDLMQNRIEDEPGFFWEDVGKLSVYQQINIAFARGELKLNLRNQKWLVRSFNHNTPAAEFRGISDIAYCRIASGCIIEQEAYLRDSVFSPEVQVGVAARVERSVIFHRVTIGKDVQIRNAIIDKDVIIPDNTMIGYSEDHDRARGFHVEDGITVVPRSYEFES